jgi:transposase-like protein
MHDKNAIREAYLEGATISAICVRFGCGKNTVSRACKALPRRRRRWGKLTPARRRRIHLLADAGVSIRDIVRVTRHSCVVVVREVRIAKEESTSRRPELVALRDENQQLRAIIESAGVA